MEISSEHWKEASIHSIKLAQTIINRSDDGVEEGRIKDPLPLLRDACVQESNTRIFVHMKSTRDVVIKLRKSLVATNDEIKSLNRAKEAIERALNHKRKDLELNKESIEIRDCRPTREKEPDCADRLLQAERSHLLSLKKSLEAQLHKVQLQLQQLNKARARLSSSIQERSRVTDLLCQSMTPSQSSQQPSTANRPFSAGRAVWNSVPHGGSSLRSSRSQSVLSQNSYGDQAACVRSNAAIRRRKHSKTLSAPPPLNTAATLGRVDASEDMRGLEALTPDAQQAMAMANEAINNSQSIRREVADAIDHTERLQKAAHSSVNEGLTRKLAQTVTMTQHLQVNVGETKMAQQRAQRYYNAQERALGYILGPVSSSDTTTRERLDRPIVRVYQRHVGTDLPEAAHFVQASGMYYDSMEATRKNMALLKLANKRLKEDVSDKKAAAFIDSDIVRLRRRKADHKWTLQGNAFPLKPAGTRSRALTT